MCGKVPKSVNKCREDFALELLVFSFSLIFRKLEKAVAVRKSLLVKFSGKFRRCWKILHRFSGSTKHGCSFFAYSWKLPAYSGAFLLTVHNFCFFAYSWSFFTYSFSFFTCNWSFFAYSGKVRLIRALRDCLQRSSTVSKKAPTVSEKASPNAIPAKVWAFSGKENGCWKISPAFGNAPGFSPLRPPQPSWVFLNYFQRHLEPQNWPRLKDDY